MQFPRILILSALVCLCAILAVAQDQGAQTPSPSIKVETRLVLVDAVVTDKKGNYIRDLTAKDFKVWEDNRQQEVTSFSFEADSSSRPGGQKRYLILFFDNSSMDFAQQAQARQAAAKFIESNAGPNRPMAIVDYVNGLRVAQNFTEDAARLKQVVANVKLAGAPSPSMPGFPSLSRAETDYRVRDGILALRSLVRNLESVPGRKSLVLLTGGFTLTPDRMSELTALIDACNKANVAVYPIDAHGLVTATPGLAPRAYLNTQPTFQLVSFTPAAFLQRTGGGGDNDSRGDHGWGWKNRNQRHCTHGPEWRRKNRLRHIRHIGHVRHERRDHGNHHGHYRGRGRNAWLSLKPSRKEPIQYAQHSASIPGRRLGKSAGPLYARQRHGRVRDRQHERSPRRPGEDRQRAG